MTLLIGDATATYPVATNIIGANQEAFRFPGLATGTLDTLKFKVSDTALCTFTSLVLGVYSDSAAIPQALLGSGTFSGTPALGDWVTVTGLAIPIVAGHDYWLAILPLGGNIFYDAAVSSGGTADWVSDSTFSSMQATWPTTSGGNIYDDGPVGFQGLGVLAAAVHEEGELRFEVTTLRYPTVDPIVICELEQFTDGEVGIPLNEGRDGQVTISVYGDAYEKLTDHYDGPVDEYAAMLRVFYDGTCVLWAPITGAPYKGQDGTVTLVASEKVRLENHEVVRGDEAIARDNPYGGRIPVDYRGLRLLRDAAINMPGQTARGVPDIGIANGTNDQPNNDVFITIERGTEIWSAWTDLVSHGPSPGHDGACDFELEPRTDLAGAYCQLNTYSHQGTDKTDSLLFEHGFGRENLAGFDSDPLGKLITHQHALGRNNKIRETRFDPTSSAYRGLYVKFEGKDYTGSDADIRIALGAWAQQQVEAYSIPKHVVKITLKPDSQVTDPLGRFRYLRDFGVGDEVHAESRRGHHREVAQGRIVKVTLKQQDQGRKALADVDIVPNVAGDGSGTGDDS